MTQKRVRFFFLFVSGKRYSIRWLAIEEINFEYNFPSGESNCWWCDCNQWTNYQRWWTYFEPWRKGARSLWIFIYLISLNLCNFVEFVEFAGCSWLRHLVMLSQMLVRILRCRQNYCRQRNRSVSTSTLEHRVILVPLPKVKRTKLLRHAFNSHETRKKKEKKVDWDPLSATSHHIYLFAQNHPKPFTHYMHKQTHTHTHKQWHLERILNYIFFSFFDFNWIRPPYTHAYRIYKLWWSWSSRRIRGTAWFARLRTTTTTNRFLSTAGTGRYTAWHSFPKRTTCCRTYALRTTTTTIFAQSKLFRQKR